MTGKKNKKNKHVHKKFMQRLKSLCQQTLPSKMKEQVNSFNERGYSSRLPRALPPDSL